MNDPTKKEIERLGEYTPLGTKEMMHQMGMDPTTNSDNQKPLKLDKYFEVLAQTTPEERIKIKKYLDELDNQKPQVDNSEFSASKIFDLIRIEFPADLTPRLQAACSDSALSVWQAIQPIVEENKELRETNLNLTLKLNQELANHVQYQQLGLQQITDLKKQLEEKTRLIEDLFKNTLYDGIDSDWTRQEWDNYKAKHNL